MSSPTFRPVAPSGGGGGVTDHGDLTGLADDDHTQYIKHSLATAINDFIVASGAGAFIKKTVTEVKTILGLGSAAYTDSTAYQAADPTLTALAGVTTAANKIPYFTGEDTAAVADLPSGYNYIINPCFEVNQRGVTSVNTEAFAVDMWQCKVVGSAHTLSQQRFTIGQTSVPGEPKYFLRSVVTSSAGNGNGAWIRHVFEGVRTLAGQTATLSFYAQTTTAPKPISIEFGQNFGTGGSPSTTVTGIGVTKLTLSTSLTKYTVTVAVPSISGKTLGTANNDYLYFILWLDAGSDWNARTDSLGQQSGTFEFANVKLEAGSVATPFVVPTYAEELRKCQRYLQVFGGNVVYEQISESGLAATTTIMYAVINLGVQMRATPSIVAPTSYANFRLTDAVNAAITLSGNPSIVTNNSTSKKLFLQCDVASGLTQYRPYYLQTLNQTTDRLIFSVEL